MRALRFEYGCACVTTDTKHHVYLKRIPGLVTSAGLAAMVDHNRGAYVAISMALSECDKTDRPVEFVIDRQTASVLDVRPSSMSWQALRRSLKATDRLRVVN